MKKYDVTGMTCSACSARVEKAVQGVEGVTACSVNLLTHSMTVEGNVSPQSIVEAVEKAGYGAAVKGEEQKAPSHSAKGKANTLRLRLWVSLGLLAVLMVVAMGHTMWGMPLPGFLAHNPVALGLIQLILTGVVLVINQRFFISGFKSLFHGGPNMDTLVAMGAGAAFVYSTAVVFLMSHYQAIGNIQMAMHQLHDLYFESAAMIVTLITLGKLLEARAKGKTTKALESLLAIAPKIATVQTPEGEKTVPVEQVQPGDVFLVRPGDSIPVDGVVLEGFGGVDQSALTGESIPVDKQAGDPVAAATLNVSGFLKCRATARWEDTTFSQILRLVEEVSSLKAPIGKLADKVSGVFVPAVLGIGLVTFLAWLMVGNPVGYALARAVSVLVISCPCALGLATPVAIMVGNGVGAKQGILFKTAQVLEETGKINLVALDKTGTVTQGKPHVVDMALTGNKTQRDLLQLAYSLENPSGHPFAKAIVAKGKEEGLFPQAVEEFQVVAGGGIIGKIRGSVAFAGNAELAKTYVSIPDGLKKQGETLAKEGQTPLYFGLGEELYGLISVADVVKEDSKTAIAALKDMGITTVLITGDNENTANAIGKQVGIDGIYAGVKPHEKEQIVASLQQSGRVAMVGDGINDAPALTRAHVGMAIGDGTQVAMDAADVVLMNNSLWQVVSAIKLSKATLRVIKQNLFWAFIYNIIGIPLAAGAFISLFGWALNPMFGAAAMSLSSVCVVSNALRLNRFRFSKGNHKNQRKEEKTMEVTMKIEGMMCGHCSGRVQQVLSALPQVEKAQVSHETGTAVITLKEDVANDLLKETVEAQGYTVTQIL